MERNLNGSQRFPKNFLFGAATASHQVEGANLNDWSEWEKKNAPVLAKKSGRGVKNHISGIATNQYELFEKDLDLAKSLGLNAYRFSIEWSRIEPKEDQFNQKEINHYVQVVKACRERDIEPFATLWHWPIPLWLRDLGGWQNKKIVDYYGRYVKKVVENLPEVKFWITLNEPMVYVSASYLIGLWPPQKKKIFTYLKVVHNLIRAHREAYKIIKKINSSLQVGIAKHNVYFEAYPNNFFSRLVTKFINWWWNEYFLKKIQNCEDFIGLNYYHHRRIFGPNENKKVSDMGWELYPKGIYYLLKDLRKFSKPIYITEHGLADAQDKNRAWYIEKSLKYIKKAIDEGTDVRGYLHWSLLDNFEWAEGFWPRFGLIKVDYDDNLKRTIRPSAQVYAELIKKYSNN